MKSEIIQTERPAPPVTTPVKEEPEQRSNVRLLGLKPVAAKRAQEIFLVRATLELFPGVEQRVEEAERRLPVSERAPVRPAFPRKPRSSKPIGRRSQYKPCALLIPPWLYAWESKVTSRLELKSTAEGKVTKAEISKSGGPGFDEEALKAVKQSRFEPAQKDGQNVAAEFIYIYRFRLAK